jgi:hypothetical protein
VLIDRLNVAVNVARFFVEILADCREELRMAQPVCGIRFLR